MDPKISIIIPVFNTEKYLHQCIKSILDQTFTDFECILIDDHSIDNSLSICNYYSNIDIRFKVIQNDKNIGPSLSRKKGISISRGSYIQFIDSDDYIEKNMLEMMYTHALLNNSDLVYCNYYYHDNFNNKIYRKVPLLSNNYIENIKSTVFDFTDSAALWNKLIKKDILKAIEFPIDSYSEDKYLSTQILFYVHSIKYINDALYHYQYNKNSLNHNDENAQRRYIEMNNNFNKIKDFIKDKYTNDLNALEPELSKRIIKINNMNPKNPKQIVKRLFHSLIPIIKDIYQA